ncbi:MAG: RluA family pseudouridine synthase [Candidatus Komeilibacteria bacterium]
MKFIYSQQGKKRLDTYLAENLDTSTRSQIQKAIKQGGVLVNDKKTTVHHWLKPGDVIEYTVAVKESRVDRSLVPTIVYQDDHYLVLDKPAGLLVHPTERGEEHTVISWLVEHFPRVTEFGDPLRPGLVHRLDRDVSGLIAIALDEPSYFHLKEQFRDRTIDKHYTGLVYGVISNDEGTISTPLERDKKTGKTKAQSVLLKQDQAHEAITHYEVIKRFHNFTLLDIKLVTGRTHQIRAHLHSIGHSLVGDSLYGTRDLKNKKLPSLPRPFLHASSLSFQSITGEMIDCHSELPSELNNLLATLK